MDETLNNIVWIILILLVVFAVVQMLYLLWLNRPSWMRRRSPSEPVMPPVALDPRRTATLPPSYSPSTIPVEGQIVVVSGLVNRDTFPLPANQFGIGRFRNDAEKILVALDERSISRRHAAFSADGPGLYYLTDTHSTYGTFLRKGAMFEQLRPGQQERLFNGDEVRFGQRVTVRFELRGDTRSSATQL
jgi:hypothetical protein